MIRKLVKLGAAALLCLGLGVARAQGPGEYGNSGPAMPMPMVNASVPLTHPEGNQHGLSQWLVGTCADCCGPIDDHNPLQTELYVRSGISFPTGSGVLSDSLDTGWAVEGGGRALCFNDYGNAAWTLDLGLLNIHNNADNHPPAVRLLNLDASSASGRATIPEATVHVHSLNRTFVYLGAGRERYLYGSAIGTRESTGARWRVGFDGGGRWGTAKAEFFEIRHLTDTLGGAYVAVHSDLDIPCGCCTYFAGVRGEWDYTWGDVLQIQNKSEFGGFNLLFSLGVRF